MAGSVVYIEVPKDILGGALEEAGSVGDVLASFVREAILSAAAAAEAGRGDLLPRKAERPRRPPAKTEAERRARKGTPIRYKAAEGERERCWAAIYEAGSTPAAVAEDALNAYRLAGGVRMDVELPWVPRLRRRNRPGQGESPQLLERAGAA